MRAGWSSEINQLPVGEALPEDFDGKVLNPSGVEIDLPFWVFKRLKKLHLLERDRETSNPTPITRAIPTNADECRRVKSPEAPMTR